MTKKSKVESRGGRPAACAQTGKSLVYMPTGIEALDKVLGGGVVAGNTVLLRSPVGAGKTSLLLQACEGFVRVGGGRVLYATAEMSKSAVAAYAHRLGVESSDVDFYVEPEGVDVDVLFDRVLDSGVRLVCLDTIQVTYVDADYVKGDIGQVPMMDAVTNMITSFAQKESVAFLVACHETKRGDFAGSEKMKSLVDVLVSLDVEYVVGPDDEPKDIGVRRLRVDHKSRQGSSVVSALVEMTPSGFQEPSLTAMRALGRFRSVL